MEAVIESRESILARIRERFDVGLLQFSVLPAYNFGRDDVSAHCLDVESRRRAFAINFREMRDWLITQGWLLSRQRRRNPASPDRVVDDIFLTPARFVELSVGYHATRQCYVDSILESGLQPGTPERQNSADRIDCEGNIYLCEMLGSPTDAGKRGTDSAHWWCDHFSRNNRFNDPQWAILKIDLVRATGHQLVRDLWSTSGVIVCGIDRIPADAIAPIPMETAQTNDA